MCDTVIHPVECNWDSLGQSVSDSGTSRHFQFNKQSRTMAMFPFTHKEKFAGGRRGAHEEMDTCLT